MPLTQPRRDNPLMNRYVSTLGMSDETLSRRAGVAYSQIYMARTRNVGAMNAAKIARAVANILGLSYSEELELKAEIMGDPGNLVHAYLGNGREAAEHLGEEPSVGQDLIGGRLLSHKTGIRVIAMLEGENAPEAVIADVRGRLKPPPSPPGRTTYTTGRRPTADEERLMLARAKPRTAAAVEASGLSKRRIYERAGVGKETLRQALYNHCGRRSAAAIARVLADAADLPDEKRQLVEDELLGAPENF